MIGRRTLLGAPLLWAALPARLWARDYEEAPAQPFFAALVRILEARRRLGEPLPAATLARLKDLQARGDVVGAQRALEPFTLLHLRLGSGGYAWPERGGAEARLIEQGWRSFLVRVVNPQGLTDPMAYSLDTPVLGQVEADSAPRPTHEPQGAQTPALMRDTVARARLDVQSYDESPLVPMLSGLAVEYRLVQLTGFSPGRHETGLMAASSPHGGYVWAPARMVRLEAVVAPARDVPLRLIGEDGRGTIAAVTVRDAEGRVYPSKQGRLAPDMYFQDQVYRADGETVRLPDGRYTLSAERGPEYLEEAVAFEVGRGAAPPPPVRLRRWVDPAARGWYSGDVHIHAAGCRHYNEPTVGVAPETMIRHVRGEGLWVGDVLTWGPGYHVQKRHFTGHTASPAAALEAPDLQAANGQTLKPRPTPTDADSLIRYDVEVSGFPSSMTGHLILLRLRDQFYPGTKGPPDWPSWSLPILQWAKAQGAVTGFAHCGLGLADLDDRIPSRVVPSFNSIGANEYLVDVAHGAVDFLAGGDTIPAAELTLWYHALNCGFRTAFVGETDWPCMSDDRVGVARTYVSLSDPPRGDAGYDAWVEGLRAGRVAMGDGRAHAFDLKVAGAGPGEEAALARPGTVEISATVAALLAPEPPAYLAGLADRPSWQEPRWHLERARKAGTRTVEAELIVDGAVAATFPIRADGSEQRIAHRLDVRRSCWVALRILPALHTQPVFVLVRGEPVRGPRASPDWCLASLDRLEKTQLPRIAEAERPAAARAYAHARAVFRRIRAECPA